jgi:hypothetical protein
MTHNFFQLNELISDLLKSNEPFSLLRIDNTMGYVLDSLQKNTTPVREFYNENTLVEGGVYPNNMDYAYDVVIPKTLEAMTYCDILGFVDLSGEIERNKTFTDLFGDKPKFYGHDSLLTLDPCALLNVDGAHQLDNPWPTYLKGKKVLVVGVAYKPNVADTRETPAEHLIEALNELGALVTWSDEVVGNWKGQSSNALSGADIAIVVTKHDVVTSEAILKAAPYVFDTTGAVKGAVQL